MATQIQVRRDTSANWTTQVLAEGEIGLELDAAIANGSKVNGIKIGDGTTAWSSLEYASLVFEHANTVVDGDNNTLYIKGKGSQSGKLVLVEGSDADVLLSIADDGTILFNEAGSGQVDFGGGSNSTGVTIQSNGDIEMSAASRLEMGSTVAGSTSAGSGVEMTTETNYGRVHLKANSSANDTDDMITVTKDTTANFVVEANGDVESAATVTGNAVVATTSVTAATAELGGGYSSTGISTTDAGNLSMAGDLVVDGEITATGGFAKFHAFRFETGTGSRPVTHAVGSTGFSVTRDSDLYNVTHTLGSENLIIVCQGNKNGANTASAKANLVVDRQYSDATKFRIRCYDSNTTGSAQLPTAFSEIHVMVWMTS